MNVIKLNIFKIFNSDFPLNIGYNEMTVNGVVSQQNNNNYVLK